MAPAEPAPPPPAAPAASPSPAAPQGTPAPPQPPAAGVLIPDLCNGAAVLRVLLISQMLAGLLVLAAPGGDLVLGPRLVLLSLFLHWISLCSCALLCAARPFLARRSLRGAVLLALAGLQLLTLLISEAAWRIGAWLQWEGFVSGHEHLLFLVRIQLIGLLVWVMLLRYFFLQQQWQQQVAAAAEAKLLALQARIRPHFLFNCLNSLVALIPQRPAEAERLVENLAELLRAALGRPDGQHTLAEEIQLTRAYLEIEQLRIGERLRVDWQVAPGVEQARVPLLSLQPLVENAIYHGIEQCAGGGTVEIHAAPSRPGMVELRVRNPISGSPGSPGRQIAQDNIRHRLALLHGAQARMHVTADAHSYHVGLELPA